jgi:hypothetical protein
VFIVPDADHPSGRASKGQILSGSVSGRILIAVAPGRVRPADHSISVVNANTAQAINIVRDRIGGAIARLKDVGLAKLLIGLDFSSRIAVAACV